MGETANINGDSTIVTYVAEGKEEEDVKKELIGAADYFERNYMCKLL